MEHCASLCESIPWNKCVLLLNIKKLRAQLCTPAVVSTGFSPEDSAWGRAGEAEDTSAQVLTQGGWWSERAQSRHFLLLFPLLPAHVQKCQTYLWGRGMCPFDVFISFQEAAFNLGRTVPYSTGVFSGKALLYENPTFEISENVSTRNRKTLHPFLL